jgi:hypothetical protein
VRYKGTKRRLNVGIGIAGRITHAKFNKLKSLKKESFQ